ncbi:hypothetical protein EDB80DRAFT_565614, partial [Ilyonectria destructans]
ASDVRVIFLSSKLESTVPKDSYHLDKAKTTMPQLSTWARYGMSKLANLHYSEALAKYNPDIKSISIHPGVVATNLSNSFFGSSNFLLAGSVKLVLKFMSVSVEKGALNSLWTATSKNAKSGEYYHPVGVTGKGSNLSKDNKVRDQLWEWTEKELQAYV